MNVPTGGGLDELLACLFLGDGLAIHAERISTTP